MSKQISLILPDEVLRRAEALARRSGQDVAEVLTDAIEVSLDPLGYGDDKTNGVCDLSDEDVLRTADAMMDPAREQRLSALLERQGTTKLNPDELAELRGLMQIYQEGLLRKATGVGEAVRRGLRQAPRT